MYEYHWSRGWLWIQPSMHICKQKNEMLPLIGNIPFLLGPKKRRTNYWAEMQDKTIDLIWDWTITSLPGIQTNFAAIEKYLYDFFHL